MRLETVLHDVAIKGKVHKSRQERLQVAEAMLSLPHVMPSLAAEPRVYTRFTLLTWKVHSLKASDITRFCALIYVS